MSGEEQLNQISNQINQVTNNLDETIAQIDALNRKFVTIFLYL